jgi:hypothetical protein
VPEIERNRAYYSVVWRFYWRLQPRKMQGLCSENLSGAQSGRLTRNGALLSYILSASDYLPILYALICPTPKFKFDIFLTKLLIFAQSFDCFPLVVITQMCVPLCQGQGFVSEQGGNRKGIYARLCQSCCKDVTQIVKGESPYAIRFNSSTVIISPLTGFSKSISLPTAFEIVRLSSALARREFYRQAEIVFSTHWCRSNSPDDTPAQCEP